MSQPPTWATGTNAGPSQGGSGMSFNYIDPNTLFGGQGLGPMGTSAPFPQSFFQPEQHQQQQPQLPPPANQNHARSTSTPGASTSARSEISAGDNDDGEDDDGEEEWGAEGSKASSAGPVRSGSSTSKKPVAAPVKAACTFCRSRKSRCNGKQPCATCIARERTDDCIYTVSRRGGKPKPKPTVNPIEDHLESLFRLSEIPQDVRVPGAMPQLAPYQDLMALAAGAPGSSNDPLGLAQPPFGASPFGNFGMTPAGQGQPSMPGLVGTAGWQSQPGQSLEDEAQVKRSVLSDYYRYLYRFIPVFLRPAYLDHAVTNMQLATSPFLLSLQAILPMLRESTDGSGQPNLQGFGGPSSGPLFASEEERQRTSQLTGWYARQASQAIDAALESDDGSQSSMSEFKTLQVVQSLCVLTIYEYGSGRALKARLKADQALGLAMAKGLHRLTSGSGGGNKVLSPQSSFASPADGASGDSSGSGPFAGVPDVEVLEMRKRTWWTVWSLVLWASYNTGHIPTIRADDPRVRSELPWSKSPRAWSSNISSLQALLLVQDRVLALAHLERNDAELGTASAATFNPNDIGSFGGLGLPSSLPFTNIGASGSGTTLDMNRGQELPASFTQPPTMADRGAVLRSMLEIDVSLQQQITQLEASGGPPVGRGSAGPGVGGTLNAEQIEDQLADYLHTSAAIQLYTASLTLHIGQAFQGASLFERKLCFLSSVSDSSGSVAACQVAMPEAFPDAAGPWGQAQGQNPLTESHPSQSSQTQQTQPQQQPVAAATVQDLYARGPFLPQMSLQRCVDASEKLLEISRMKNEQPSPNPFNSCSFVLISFVCLMQALATSGGMTPEADESMAGGSLLRSAQGAAALGGDASSTAYDGATPERASRLLRLQLIWRRVNEARSTLAGLAKNWRIALPMYEEVTVCLAASQQLLAGQMQQ